MRKNGKKGKKGIEKNENKLEIEVKLKSFTNSAKL